MTRAFGGGWGDATPPTRGFPKPDQPLAYGVSRPLTPNERRVHRSLTQLPHSPLHLERRSRDASSRPVHDLRAGGRLRRGRTSRASSPPDAALDGQRHSGRVMTVQAGGSHREKGFPDESSLNGKRGPLSTWEDDLQRRETPERGRKDPAAARRNAPLPRFRPSKAAVLSRPAPADTLPARGREQRGDHRAGHRDLYGSGAPRHGRGRADGRDQAV